MKRNTTHLILSLLLLLIPGFSLQAQQAIPWQEVNTVAEVCDAYPDRITFLLESLNLETAGLAEVKQAFEKGDLARACEALLTYYREGEQAEWLRRSSLPPASTLRNSAADSILQDIFTVQGVSGKSPRLANGHIDWFHTGPRDDQEWAWGVNRNYPIRDLLPIYYKEGNPEYVRAIDGLIKDWVLSSLPYPAKKSSTAMWRGLEASFRVKMWAQVFYGLMDHEGISPATRLLLMSSIPHHAHYARHFHAKGNWLTMEMAGLATAAAAWPEFKDAPQWIEYGKARMTESIGEQIYPDGVQTELTSHYHYVALRNFDQFRQILSEIDEPLPEVFASQIKSMWVYLAYSMRPDGFGPMNNDSDRDYNRERILTAAEQYDRPDWQHIASNGTAGKAPASGPSIVFPNAGQMIMRSGFEKDAHWAFFDIGPWGSGHQHNDKLHLSISAYGRDLLVDGGRFAYRGAIADTFRTYARGSESHNVLLIDGKGQTRGPLVSEAPLPESNYRIEKAFDYAWGDFDTFEELEGTATHTRTVCYVRGNFWIVVDHIDTDRPRTVQALWHWHPDSKVNVLKKQVVATDHDRGNLRIVPVGKPKWDIDLISGQQAPTIQGYYSERYNEYEAATASIYSTRIETSTSFVWLLGPSEGEAPKLKVKVLSETEDGVTLRVKGEDKVWEIEVPFRDGDGVLVE